MSPLILLLLLPIIFLSLRIILTLTGWLVCPLCVVAMIAVVVGLIVFGGIGEMANTFAGNLVP